MGPESLAPGEIEDQARRVGEGEVLDFDGTAKIDDDRHLAARRPDAHGPHFSIPGSPPGGGEDLGHRGGQQAGGEGNDAVHGVSSCLASDRVS